jgi:hypothetical protein
MTPSPKLLASKNRRVHALRHCYGAHLVKLGLHLHASTQKAEWTNASLKS